jgi:two-component system, LytTR family, response regulator
MFKAVIIDDINNSRVTLRHDLEKYCPQIQVIGEADGVTSGLKIISDLIPEVVFLDIQLTDGTGFDLLEKLGESDFQVIFTTALDAYGIKAVKFSALDYLLKPIDPDELIEAVNKLKNNKRKKNVKDSINLLLENIRDIQPSNKRIALNCADKVHMVFIKDIIRCESQGNYVIFFLAGREQIIDTKTLRDYELLLEDYNFIRVHHSHLINIAYLREYIKKDGGYAVMSDGCEVPVSFRKRNHLLELLGL